MKRYQYFPAGFLAYFYLGKSDNPECQFKLMDFHTSSLERSPIVLKHLNTMNKLSILAIILILISFSAFGQNKYVKINPKIAYWELGNKKEMVIVVHGGPGVSHDYLRPEWDQLAKYATEVYYDQRGNGASDTSDCYSWRMHVLDLKRLIDSISKDKKVILAGSSWGSVLAVLFAYSYPEMVKGMILTGLIPWPGRGQMQRDCSFYNFNEKKFARIQDQYKHLMNNDQEGKNNQPELLGSKEDALLKERISKGSTRVRMETMSSLADAPKIDQLNLDMPTLILQGEDSCFYPDVSKMYSTGVFSNSKIDYIQGACHDPWIVQPEIFFNECGQFIAKF